MARIIAKHHTNLTMSLPGGKPIVFTAEKMDREIDGKVVNLWVGVCETDDKDIIEYCRKRSYHFEVQGLPEPEAEPEPVAAVSDEQVEPAPPKRKPGRPRKTPPATPEGT